MSLHLQPVRIATGTPDTESQLVFADGFLVAVLVRLSDDHGDMAGMWYLEAGFGPVEYSFPPTFTNLDEAQAWIEQRLPGAPHSL
ncbi:hypothetical protein GCM10007886_29440 [Methylobacterium gregans]|uniref:Uncharacterized protein n=1 Tax=Methylobacterium gregans TaxID=374424 RepID=A0AA37HUF5_9HYPH|nr:hypothetical protein [Methylobacterium gregans]GJD82118.1 hypothetical protein NBEOAGPD_5378 [Methylobacterium gregans]GLS54760.1 hypothetical protein GCM10007886_29440 [Methylobacterium gregans]